MLLAWPGGVFGWMLPSFRLDGCAWEATHIVVVTGGDKFDGCVKVVESWKGDLKRGDTITVPELAEFAPDKMRVISKGLFQKDKDLPASVTCSRMVLFLIKRQEKGDGDKPGKTTWFPANDSWKQMNVSVAWIEADKVFAFAQWINPGPSELIFWGMKESELSSRIEKVVGAQKTLAEAIRENEADKLLSAVPPLLRSDSSYVREAVIRQLGESGTKGLPALREILKDESFLNYHDAAILALGKAGGVTVGPELTEVLKKELAFWKKVGPGLKEEGWWNGAGVKWEEVEGLRNHYSRVHAALRALKAIRFAECRETVTAFRDYWKSLPQLGGNGFDQLEKACDAVLANEK
jgi:hypothetical protein